MDRHLSCGKRLGRRGTASVELALVAPILVFLMMGVVELGLMFSAYMQLRTISREGARSAAVGNVPADVEARMDAVSGSLNAANMTVTLQYRTYYTGGSWSAWQTLGTDGESNTAPTGAHVRASISYQHQLAMPGMFGCLLATDPDAGTRTLLANVVMRRE
jgi:Flp pilus assembly protein TadG